MPTYVAPSCMALFALNRTHDVSTMRKHFERFIETRNSPGVVMIPQRLPYHETINRLLRLWATTEAEQWENVLFYLPR